MIDSEAYYGEEGDDYYVYTHTLRSSGEVFYIGKGKDYRAFDVVSRTDLWKSRALDSRGEPLYDVGWLEYDVSEEHALKMERKYILDALDKGVRLVNKQVFGHLGSDSLVQSVKNSKRRPCRCGGTLRPIIKVDAWGEEDLSVSRKCFRCGKITGYASS